MTQGPQGTHYPHLTLRKGQLWYINPEWRGQWASQRNLEDGCARVHDLHWTIGTFQRTIGTQRKFGRQWQATVTVDMPLYGSCSNRPPIAFSSRTSGIAR